jgi:LysM domain
MTRPTATSPRIVVAGFLLAGLVAACDFSALEPPVTPSPTPVPTSSPTPSFVRPTPLPQPTFLVYVVAAGDSLSSIATAYGTSAQSIAYWNRATYPSLDPESPRYDPNTIQVGWALVLIPFAQVDPEDLPPPAQTPTPSLPSPEASVQP